MRSAREATTHTPVARGTATAVGTSASFLLFCVSLQAADLISERASLSHEVNLPRMCIVQPRPGASAADRD